MLVQGTPDGGDRGTVTAAHARHPHNANARPERSRQHLEQLLGSHYRTSETVANPHRQGRWWGRAVPDEVEMRVERGDFIDLDQREAHLARERDQVAGMQAAEAVLQEM